MKNFFDDDVSKMYDERNSKLLPIMENMHFLIQLVLKDLPIQARILCVGVGTGAEIISLSKAFPQWTFIGVDPSASMLDVCRNRLEDAGIRDRCELIHGYVYDVPMGESFDAAVAVLVGHFVSIEDRLEFYQNMYTRLISGGYLITTEISVDVMAEHFPSLLQNWEQVQLLMGATPQSLKALPTLFTEILTVLPPVQVEQYIQMSGFSLPIRFFQAFMISGWYAKK